MKAFLFSLLYFNYVLIINNFVTDIREESFSRKFNICYFWLRIKNTTYINLRPYLTFTWWLQHVVDIDQKQDWSENKSFGDTAIYFTRFTVFTVFNIRYIHSQRYLSMIYTNQ